MTTPFERAKKREDLGRGIAFNALRHSFASWYMIDGGDLYRLKKYLGHSRIMPQAPDAGTVGA